MSDNDEPELAYIGFDPIPTEVIAQVLLEKLFPSADWDGPDLMDTPRRFVQMYQEMTTPEDFSFTTFENKAKVDGTSQLVTVKNIAFTALCAHHIVPFIGHCHIGYIPDKKLAGLSKFPRAVRWWAKGLWTQEDLTHAIASYLDDELDPDGLIVMMEAEHMCMSLRGVLAPGTKTVTTQLRGLFLNPPSGRDPKSEFLEYIKR